MGNYVGFLTLSVVILANVISQIVIKGRLAQSCFEKLWERGVVRGSRLIRYWLVYAMLIIYIANASA